MCHEDSNHWKQGISQELRNMDKHGVLSPISNRKEIKALTTTWVFMKKTDENGYLTKYKATLCMRVFNQGEGIDYNDVFSLSAFCSHSVISINSKSNRSTFIVPSSMASLTEPYTAIVLRVIKLKTLTFSSSTHQSMH
ncbi:hypothetical protein O181_089455 [Austropuccinia psidii MF-1]|uniref:Reverse transcriptase Ty1/copia-type domain-containing protein n=1 Tax=Austropuccinia psidii MF-1 TaxID=1389203 RepID=A0A9Q3P5U2_9BASI|nr:hypothetical protein [Austropuccinia psidii MF-1]